MRGALYALGFLQAAARLPEVPGLFTTGSSDGSLFARGFDPITGASKQGVVDFHYSGDADHTWGQPETGRPFALPNELNIYSIPGRQMDTVDTDLTNITTVKTWKYKYHWSALILLVVNAAEIDASGFMKWAFNDTEHMSKLTEDYATSYKVTGKS